MPGGRLTKLLQRRLLPVWFLFLLPLSGCTLPRLPFTGASSPPRAQSGLAAADHLFFTGNYDAAETAYQRLAMRSVRDARSHYALLLAYENRFPEAVAAGLAGVKVDRDSASLARLTRAYDWSEDFPSALATGASAVATTPVDPLAHVFYAEALADTGDFPAARAQLQAAARYPATPYLKSEIDREWANYYRDGGDVSQADHFFEASYRAMPKFPERSLELARIDYAIGAAGVAQARSFLTRIEARYPRRYWLLVSAAQVALLAPDDDTAVALYSAALRAQPNGSAAALGLAEMDVAQKRDFGSAHDVLLGAYRAHPSSVDVYLYLRYLDLLVTDRSPDRDLGPEPPAARTLVAQLQDQALRRTNAYRALVGLHPLGLDGALETGAIAHAYYFLFNYGNASESGLGVHGEKPGLPGYTGVNGLLRGRHFGYPGVRGAEVIDHVYAPDVAVQVWVDSVYHRLPILDPESEVMGYGQAAVGPLSIQVMDTGMALPGHSGGIAYPYPGQQGVTPYFLDNELPNPLPASTSLPAGYPITLQFGGADHLRVVQAQVTGPSGQVPIYALQPGSGDLGAWEWSALPQQPLQPDATYTVSLRGSVNGAPYSKRWSFRVAGSTGVLT